MKLAVTIYGVPSRRQYQSRLLAHLDEKPQLLLDTHGVGLWPMAHYAWGKYPPGATHHLVMQDDVMPAPMLTATARHLVELYPDIIMSLYSNRRAGREAMASGSRWHRFRDCTFGQALLLPTRIVDDWLNWCHENIDPRYKYDDARLGAYCSARGIDIHATAPALVQHMAPADSTIGISNRTRVSPYFFGTEGDPRTLDWTAGFPGKMVTRPGSIYEDAYLPGKYRK